MPCADGKRRRDGGEGVKVTPQTCTVIAVVYTHPNQPTENVQMSLFLAVDHSTSAAMSQHDSDDQSGREPESPRVGSPMQPLTPPPPVAKKTLSDAQKASLARAREKARASKLAKS